jgi:S1-C subfamily serine protease
MSEEGQPAAEVPLSLLWRLSQELVDMVARVAPSVVALNGAGRVSGSWGSGFLVDREGHVVTNFHVVDGITGPVEAILHGGAHCTAAIVGMDAITDLAVVRLETPPPTTSSFGRNRLGWASCASAWEARSASIRRASRWAW